MTHEEFLREMVINHREEEYLASIKNVVDKILDAAFKEDNEWRLTKTSDGQTPGTEDQR